MNSLKKQCLVLALIFPANSVFATKICSDNAHAVLSSSSPNQQHFAEREFLPSLFNEFVEIIRINEIVIKNEKIRDIFLRFDDDARNPHIVNLFEVANIFGTNVSDLLKHYGNLVDFVDPSGIMAKKRPLTPKEHYRISERFHLHLSGLINEVLRKKNLTLEELAFQTSIKLEVFQQITIDAGLPRLFSLLQILNRLDTDVVDFFRRFEANWEEVSPPRYFRGNPVSTHKRHKRLAKFEKRTKLLSDTIDGELEEIFENFDQQDLGDGAMRFGNMVFNRKLIFENRRLKTKTKRRVFHLKNIFQTAHMLGMRPSEVLKYAGDLKSHAKLDDFKNKTLLSDETVLEFLDHVKQGLTSLFKSSGMQKEELAEATQLSLRYLKDIDSRGLNPSYSILERILEALGSNAIRFFEELESKGLFDVPAVALPSATGIEKKGKLSSQTMGKKITQMREILPLASHKFNRMILGGVSNSTDLAQRNLYFKTIYKVSRMANISLSRLAGKAPIETLIDPHGVKIEKIPREEINKAEWLLTHLLLSEARRQKDVSGLTVMGLAIKSHLMMRHVRKILSGEIIPPYSVLHQIVEGGLGIPLFRFFEDFETKLKSFDRIPFASKKTVLELEGLYLSKRVKTRMKKLQKRFDSGMEFVKSLNISWEELEAATGIQFRFYKKKTNTDHYQVFTFIKFCHFLGIGIRDFLGSRHFSELTAIERLNFERLSEEHLLSAVAGIKRKASERRKALNLSMRDLEIMIGAPVEKKLVNSLFGESIKELAWFRYFQLAEILARDGEDDLFLLDGVDL